MTANKRIFLNIVATYGRSLYMLAIGLCCGRWTLQALGEVSYGLFGLIGGMTGFVAFINGLLASAVGRFYAVAVGSCKIPGNEENGLEDCRQWFNTAVLLHVIVSTVLLIVGYPIGVWAIKRFLEIPVDRVVDCVWVWRYTCIGCFVSMITVPFNAMYIARQKIAELTIYSFITSTLNAAVLYYMIMHPGNWLVAFACITMILSIAPNVIISFVAWQCFSECKFIRVYLWSKNRAWQIVRFAFARFWTALSQIINAQGNAILVNKYMGPCFNATISVGNSVASQATTLSSSISGAFWPVIANKAGEKDFDGMREFAFRTCKISTIMILIFVIPLVLEAENVIELWLVNPPNASWIVCVAVLISLVLERMTEGYWMAIIAEGSGISIYSLVVSISGFSGFFATWVLLSLGYGIYGVCCGLVFSWIVTVLVRLILGWKLVNLSACVWCRQIFFPLLLISVISFMVGAIPRLLFPETFFRVCLTTLACELVMVPLVWFIVMNEFERKFLKERVMKMVKKRGNK